MKKFIFLVMVFLFSISILLSHPPNKVEIKYNLEKDIVDVTIYHGSNNLKKHYINEIHLWVNGRKIVKQTNLTQFEGKKQFYLYKIPNLKKGDIIQVIAKCSVYGTKKTKVEIK